MKSAHRKLFKFFPLFELPFQLCWASNNFCQSLTTTCNQLPAGCNSIHHCSLGLTTQAVSNSARSTHSPGESCNWNMEALFLKPDKARTVEKAFRSHLTNILLKKGKKKINHHSQNSWYRGRKQKSKIKGKGKKIPKNSARNQNVLGKHQHKILV